MGSEMCIRDRFKPDVDGTYQLTVKLSDDLDTQDVTASFVIPNVLHWKPLSGVEDFACACSTASRAALPIPALVMLLLGWVRRRR